MNACADCKFVVYKPDDFRSVSDFDESARCGLRKYANGKHVRLREMRSALHNGECGVNGLLFKHRSNWFMRFLKGK